MSFSSHPPFKRTRRTGKQERNGINVRACRPRLEGLEVRVVPTVTVSPTQTFAGLNFNDTLGFEPPDTIAAAGPNQIVETVNTTIAYYDKTGKNLFKQDLGTFFAPLGGVLSLSDPVVAYDELKGRFVVGVLDFDTTLLQSRFDFAVSNTSDPSAGWTLKRFDMNDLGPAGYVMADYPRMGWNADGYVISFNMFLNGSTFDHVDVLTIDKTLINGVRTVVPGGANNFTMAPATEHGSLPGSPMWLIQEGTAPNTVALVRMDGVATKTPTFTTTTVPVASYGAVPAAPQLGGGTFATNDSRMLNAALRTVGSVTHLVAAQTVGTGGAAHARWYDFNIPTTVTVSPSLSQYGEINPGAGEYTYFPSIEISTTGDLGMTYLQSSANEYVSMYVTGRKIDDPAGSMQIGALAQAGIDNYVGARGGDYSGITVDPVDGVSFWAANEYAQQFFSYWGTWIAKFNVTKDTAPPPPPPPPSPPPPPPPGGGDGNFSVGTPPNHGATDAHVSQGTGEKFQGVAVALQTDPPPIALIDPTGSVEKPFSGRKILFFGQTG